MVPATRITVRIIAGGKRKPALVARRASCDTVKLPGRPATLEGPSGSGNRPGHSWRKPRGTVTLLPLGAMGSQALSRSRSDTSAVHRLDGSGYRSSKRCLRHSRSPPRGGSTEDRGDRLVRAAEVGRGLARRAARRSRRVILELIRAQIPTSGRDVFIR